MLSLAAGPLGLTIILAILSLLAAVVSFYAAARGAIRTIIPNVLRGFLASCYFVGYVFLIVFHPDRGQWSIFMSWFGLASWPAVWIFPSLFTYKIRNLLATGDRTDV